MKLTKKQIQSINDALTHLERAYDYINRERTVVCIKNGSSGSDCFKNENEDYTITPVNKEYGSNLTGLSMGISSLKKFIVYNTTDHITEMD